MGLFWPTLLKPLKEAEVDGQDYGEDSQDYAPEEAPAQEAPPAEQPAEEAPPQEDPQQPAEQPEDAPPPEEGGTDYTQMGEEPPPDEGGGEAPSPEEEGSEVDPIKQQEEDMFDLSPEELDIKHKELKNNYLAMFDLVQSISERINDASTTDECIPVIDYVAKQLSQLENMLTDYMNNVYKTKSYIENSINYNRFLAVLNGIDKILVEMNKKVE